jgi:hypothetical protein
VYIEEGNHRAPFDFRQCVSLSQFDDRRDAAVLNTDRRSPTGRRSALPYWNAATNYDMIVLCIP